MSSTERTNYTCIAINKNDISKYVAPYTDPEPIQSPSAVPELYIRKIRKGINNPGQVCYMNSAMNLLLDMPELLTYEGGDDKHQILFNNLRAIYNNNSDTPHINAEANVICLHGNKNVQQDSSEWLNPVLDAICDDTNTNISEYFQIKTLDTFYCKSDKKEDLKKGSRTRHWENNSLIQLKGVRKGFVMVLN